MIKPSQVEQNGLVIDQGKIDAFRKTLRGPLYLEGDSGYNEFRLIWNGMIDRCPAGIARCLGVADVQSCLKFAAENELPISIRGGGHNIAGLSVGDGALMIDLSLMRGVHVDPAGRVARAQAGCLLSDVDKETQVHGLAAVLGFASTTGIAGLTLGGGFGYLTRQFGWTCDNVRSMEVVTSDGRVVQASKTENPELFWALRGGGGNFGIVTSFEYELYEVGPEILGGAIAWDAKEAPAVLEMYRSVLENAPPELTVVAGLRMAPPAPWIDKSMHGKPIIVFFVCYSGDVEKGNDLVAPIKAFGSPIGDVIQPRPYVQQQSLIDATQPHGRRYYWKSEYLPGVAPEMTEPLIRKAQDIVSPHGAILLFPLDGKLNQLPEDYSAVGNRDTKLVINIAAGWDNAADDDVNIEWAQKTWEELKAFSTGGVYVNFLTEEEGEERTRAAYRSNYDRLAALKTKWDPANVFSLNKNIRPKN